jgi:hypothetical protein
LVLEDAGRKPGLRGPWGAWIVVALTATRIAAVPEASMGMQEPPAVLVLVVVLVLVLDWAVRERGREGI